MESIVKISDLVRISCLLFVTAVGAQDHPDAMFLKEDAEWSHDMARRHHEATRRVGKEIDAYADWFEQSGARTLSDFWWTRLSEVYGRELGLLQADIDSTRKRFLARSPECIRALDEFEHGLYREVRDHYAQYSSANPMHEWLGPAIIGVFAGFPNPTCMIRHENVRKANEALQRVRQPH